MKDIDADYYGYRDDEDGILLPLEAAEEQQAISDAVEMWKQKKEDRMQVSNRHHDASDSR